MFKLMGKEINTIFGTQSILIWTYDTMHGLTLAAITAAEKYTYM